jgi:hypothetical protein
MGYQVKLQKVERPTCRSYYLNFPMALAEALEVQKGEIFEWSVQDRHTFVLKRVRPHKPKTTKNLRRLG